MSEQETVGVREMCKALGVSDATLRRLRKDPGFPKPLPMRGRPRWARSVVDAFVNRHQHAVSDDRAEVAAALILQERPELLALRADEQHARCIEALEQKADEMRRCGRDAFWHMLAQKVRMAGANIMAAAERLAR